MVKVRFIRTYLHHSMGDVEQFDVEKAKRLISLGAALLHVEADFIVPPDPIEEDMEAPASKTKEMVPPQDKMVRSSQSKAPKKKQTKKRGKKPRKASTQG